MFKIIIRILIALCLALAILLAGCRMVWTDDVFYLSVLTEQKMDLGHYYRDPNTFFFGVGQYQAIPEKIKVLYPPLFIETGE